MGGKGTLKSNYMDRFIDSIEWIAAIFVGVVAADVFISIFLRYFFSIQIPDSYDFGQLLLGILIFWGIAATSYRGTHITVDLLYANVRRRWQRVMDVFATLVLLFVVAVQTYTLFDKVITTRADNVQTFDLRIPVWPFFAVAWIGDVAAVLLIAVRTYRLIFHPELMKKPDEAGQAGASEAHEHRRGRHHRLRQPVHPDAAARAGRHGDGPRRRHRLRLPHLRRAGAEDRRPHHDAHRDRLQFRRGAAVPADGRVRHDSGMSRELFRAANAFLGHLRGGLGIATIAACGGFAAICGSSVATAATFSKVAYPEMRRFGYPQSFATGVIAAGGTLGIMIPPSTVFAIYGLITEQDVGKLFIAGIIPGMLAVSMYMITITIIGYARPGFLPRASARRGARSSAR